MARETQNDLLLLHALADDELDAATVLALEQRIAAEPVLAAHYAQIRALKNAVTQLGRPPVSDAFRARIAAMAPPVSPLRTRRPSTDRPAWWPSADWRAMAAALVMTACLASGLTYTLIAPGGNLAEDAILSGHRRSLLAASPIDIASSDRHTVRPWFDGKLGLSPPTPDLSARGFALVGGRIDVIGGQPVPSLVYKHKEHLISVVAIPVPVGEGAVQAPTKSQIGGYNVVRWTGPGFRYWAISDLDAEELDALVQDLRSQ